MYNYRHSEIICSLISLLTIDYWRKMQGMRRYSFLYGSLTIAPYFRPVDKVEKFSSFNPFSATQLPTIIKSSIVFNKKSLFHK